MTNLLNDDSVSDIDRLRLVMLYALRYEKESPVQLMQLFNKLASRSPKYKPGVTELIQGGFIWLLHSTDFYSYLCLAICLIFSIFLFFSFFFGNVLYLSFNPYRRPRSWMKASCCCCCCGSCLLNSYWWWHLNIIEALNELPISFAACAIFVKASRSW